MAESGLDLAVWLTLPGVLLVFFGLPMAMLEYDRRKKLREARRLTADDGDAGHTVVTRQK